MIHWKMIHKKKKHWKQEFYVIFMWWLSRREWHLWDSHISFEEADDDDGIGLFKQWIKNEKFTNLAIFQSPLNECMDELCSQLDKLWFNHFVFKAQAALICAI